MDVKGIIEKANKEKGEILVIKKLQLYVTNSLFSDFTKKLLLALHKSAPGCFQSHLPPGFILRTKSSFFGANEDTALLNTFRKTTK